MVCKGEYSLFEWKCHKVKSISSTLIPLILKIVAFFQSSFNSHSQSHSSSKSSLSLLISRHQQHMISLKTLCDQPIPQTSKSTTDQSDTISNKSLPNSISSPPTSTKIPLRPLVPPIPRLPLFDFHPSPPQNSDSTLSNLPGKYYKLLKPPQISLASVDLSVAILLDSLIPSPSLPPSPIISPPEQALSSIALQIDCQPTLTSIKNAKKIPTTNSKQSKRTPIIPITSLPSSPRTTKSNPLRRSMDSNTSSSTSFRKVEKKVVESREEVRGRYESDLSIRSIGKGMGKEVKSLLDELLDDSGLMMDDDGHDDSY